MTAGRSLLVGTQDWCTPPFLVDSVTRVLGRIDLDPCSNEHSHVDAMVRYQLPHHDGLKESWDYPTIYLNPPYGRDRARGTTIRDWLGRLAVARQAGAQAIALIPVATNTRHWKQFVYPVASTEMEVYDSVKHWALKIPTKGCDTCPPPERQMQLDPEGKIWPQ